MTPLDQHLSAIRQRAEQCPWPADVWTMTDAQYVEAVPDPAHRTAISGMLMRKGWELANENTERLLALITLYRDALVMSRAATKSVTDADAKAMQILEQS